MELTLSRSLFLGLVAAVGTMRLVELAVSRRHRALLVGNGARPIAERHFPLMVVLHAGVLASAAVEALAVDRAPPLPLTTSMLVLLMAANALRLWVIATLGVHWNVRVMDSRALGVVADGPFRFVRHPNYVAVFVELVALPLVHAAYVTASLGALLHLFVLYHRVQAEEAVLLANPEYRSLMGGKPRFLPWRGLAR